MNSNHRNLIYDPKRLICVYTNENRNEFAIGLEKDENFRTMTKIGESCTRFVDCYHQKINDESEFDWKLELRRWIVAAKKNESIYVEIDLTSWNHEGERIG